jgi:hypothetical protein
MPRPIGEVGQGALADTTALTPALSQQDGGRRIPVGDGLDVRGNKYRGFARKVKGYTAAYMGTLCAAALKPTPGESMP